MNTYSKVYDNFSQAERAVLDLQDAGVPSNDISLVTNKTDTAETDAPDDLVPFATGAGLGSLAGGGVGLLTGLGLMAIPGVGPVVAAGWLASTAVGAIAGSATGGLIGALVGTGLHQDDAQFYTEAVQRGGTLVAVKTSLASDRIETILNRHMPIDPIVRRPDYENADWNQSDPEASDYQPDHTVPESNQRL
jgi:hypothetical protein